MNKVLPIVVFLSVIVTAVLAAPGDHTKHGRKHQRRLHVGQLLKELKSLDGGRLQQLRELMAHTHVLAKITKTRKPNKSHLTLLSPSRNALRKVHIVGKNPAIARLLKEMFGEKKGAEVAKQTVSKAKSEKRPKHEHKAHKRPAASKKKEH